MMGVHAVGKLKAHLKIKRIIEQPQQSAQSEKFLGSSTLTP
jgi:hypothetical protein